MNETKKKLPTQSHGNSHLTAHSAATCLSPEPSQARVKLGVGECLRTLATSKLQHGMQIPSRWRTEVLPVASQICQHRTDFPLPKDIYPRELGQPGLTPLPCVTAESPPSTTLRTFKTHLAQRGEEPGMASVWTTQQTSHPEP